MLTTCQVIFPIIPMHGDLERMKQGGNHWQWHPERPYYIGVLPRRGAKPTDIKVHTPTAQKSSPQY